MTDITERLRDIPRANLNIGELVHAAAEEIDRLRARLNTAGHAHLDGAHLSGKVDGCLLCEAMTERETLRARVAELEAARGEPGVWLRDQRGSYEGPETLDPMFYLGAADPGRGANGATYSPLYTAPPAPAVDVDAISDEALNAAWSYIIFNAENEQTEAVYDMRAALRAIFNKGE